ncbi:hypothetical protein RND81_14G015100 [Saponaria officinalis]|uniref:DRBM domain-containing protein n=1 Tax=Saponaria officinalis TaxID=3572 RepID=A0AAW1GK78_SAPOF
MYKNQLQELAQRSCFNLPSYACIREGPDHAPRFKAVVNFNGEGFVSPHYCSTLRQAEHSAAEVALTSLSSFGGGSSLSLAARILDETGVYKNLLQEISQRVGAPLPHYITFRSGVGHHPVFTGKVELAGITFTGEPAKTKKQAEKNAALAAWQSLKKLAQQTTGLSSEHENSDELEQVSVARALLNYRLKQRMKSASSPPLPFPQTFPVQNPRPSSSPQRPTLTTSKILPFICPKKTPSQLRPSFITSDNMTSSSRPQRQRLLGVGAIPYIPIRNTRPPCHNLAPPVTIRSAMLCRSAPPVRIAPPVCIRQSIPVCSAVPVSNEAPSKAVEAIQSPYGKTFREFQKPEPAPAVNTAVQKEDPSGPSEGVDSDSDSDLELQRSEVLAKLEQIQL